MPLIKVAVLCLGLLASHVAGSPTSASKSDTPAPAPAPSHHHHHHHEGKGDGPPPTGAMKRPGDGPPPTGATARPASFTGAEGPMPEGPRPRPDGTQGPHADAAVGSGPADGPGSHGPGGPHGPDGPEPPRGGAGPDGGDRPCTAQGSPNNGPAAQGGKPGSTTDNGLATTEGEPVQGAGGPKDPKQAGAGPSRKLMARGDI